MPRRKGRKRLQALSGRGPVVKQRSGGTGDPGLLPSFTVVPIQWTRNSRPSFDRLS
jgi:hypothetical protein